MFTISVVLNPLFGDNISIETRSSGGQLVVMSQKANTTFETALILYHLFFFFFKFIIDSRSYATAGHCLKQIIRS